MKAIGRREVTPRFIGGNTESNRSSTATSSVLPLHHNPQVDSLLADYIALSAFHNFNHLSERLDSNQRTLASKASPYSHLRNPLKIKNPNILLRLLLSFAYQDFIQCFHPTYTHDNNSPFWVAEVAADVNSFFSRYKNTIKY